METQYHLRANASSLGKPRHPNSPCKVLAGGQRMNIAGKAPRSHKVCVDSRTARVRSHTTVYARKSEHLCVLDPRLENIAPPSFLPSGEWDLLSSSLFLVRQLQTLFRLLNSELAQHGLFPGRRS